MPGCRGGLPAGAVPSAAGLLAPSPLPGWGALLVAVLALAPARVAVPPAGRRFPVPRVPLSAVPRVPPRVLLGLPPGLRRRVPLRAVPRRLVGRSTRPNRDSTAAPKANRSSDRIGLRPNGPSTLRESQNGILAITYSRQTAVRSPV